MEEKGECNLQEEEVEEGYYADERSAHTNGREGEK